MPDQPAAPPMGDASRPARPRRALPFVLGLMGALVGIVGYVAVVDPGDSGTEATPTATSRPTATTLADPVSVEVYQTIQPSVVFISGSQLPSASVLGSGVIVNEQGHILTALHVVENLTSINVRFADGSETTAEIIGTDPEHDIAVLETAAGPQVIVPAVLGGGVRVGDDAFVVANPLGLVSSLSAGVISGLERRIDLPEGEGALEGLIQFDAAVNPGSSGGPLLDRNGQVVGIVTALANPTGRSTFSGIGFAVPIATASGAAGGPER
jgi:S1-C subfamily serine protease